MDDYKGACSTYLANYIKHEVSAKTEYTGWYHFIEDAKFSTVGIVATAEVLILIKDLGLDVPFDCLPMLRSLISMQNKDGGWNYRSNIHLSSTEPTALAVLAIFLWRSELGGDADPVITNGIEWLLTYKNKDCMWGPIKKKEADGYTYFTCVVINSLSRLTSDPSLPFFDDLCEVIAASCKTLIRTFNNNENQPGWGEDAASQPTVFHTAFVIGTLLRITPEYRKEFRCMRAAKYIENFIQLDINEESLSFRSGVHEIYQQGTKRLVYTHSYDVYVLQALLLYYDGGVLPTYLDHKCKQFLDTAESTNWYYQGFITCWRMYDVLSLCGLYESITKKGRGKMKHYKIALTFAGESRDLVAPIAELLAEKYGKDAILYDKFHEAEFARPRLDVYLQSLYHDHSDLIVVFICKEYANKKWCGVEWHAIGDILNDMQHEKIMYIMCDRDIENVNLPGFYSNTDGFVNAYDHTVEELAGLIIERYEQLSE